MDRTVTLTERERARISQALLVLKNEKVKAAIVAGKGAEDIVETVNEIDAMWKKIFGEGGNGE